MSDSKAVVYIVEDDTSFRRSMERLVRAAGYEAVAFESAKSFLSQGAIRHPACLLLDVRLPDIDGFHLQRKLMEKDIHLPIIFMTGHGTTPMGVKAMKNGAVDFLPKPFDVGDILNAIDKALERDTHP